jgi:putative sterol carrier protein
MSLETTTAAVTQKAGTADAIGSTIKFVFNGGEGQVFLDGSGPENTVSNEDKEAACTVKVDKEDFDAMLSGELDPMGAFMGGKLAIEGDMSVAMTLTSIF